MSDLLQLKDDEFQSKVLESSLPVLIDFWAPWCGPCRMIEPIVEDLAQEYDGRMVFARMNTDENPITPTNYSIFSIPALLLFKDGELIARAIGVRPKHVLQEWIDNVLE